MCKYWFLFIYFHSLASLQASNATVSCHLLAYVDASDTISLVCVGNGPCEWEKSLWHRGPHRLQRDNIPVLLHNTQSKCCYRLTTHSLEGTKRLISSSVFEYICCVFCVSGYNQYFYINNGAHTCMSKVLLSDERETDCFSGSLYQLQRWWYINVVSCLFKKKKSYCRFKIFCVKLHLLSCVGAPLRVCAIHFPELSLLPCLSSAAAESSVRRGDDRPLCP